MLRNPLPQNFDNKKDLVFQIIDWRSYDYYEEKENDDDEEEYDEEESNQKKIKKERRLIIRGYGVTENGNSICLHIKDFLPYFFFKIPQDWTDVEFNYFKVEFLKLIDYNMRDSLVNSGIVKKKEFYGFTNNELFGYGIFVLKNQSAYYCFLKAMKEKIVHIKKLNKDFGFSNKLYETKVSSLLRFFHVQNLDPSGWSKINANKFIINRPSLSRSQIDVTINYNDIQKVEKNDVGKLIVASFDIECCSEDGTFPKYERMNDPIIQIGTTVYFFGNNECAFKYISTLGKCDPIEDALVECFETEKDCIMGWVDFMRRLDPDIITGYNIWGFDWDYIYGRAMTGNGGSITPYHELLYRKLQRLNYSQIEKRKVELTIQDLSSSALGVNILKFIDIEGIVQMDLLKVVQRDHKLDSYKLDNVAKHFMKQQKVDLSPKELFNNFKDGSPEKIKEIAVYCIMDCKLVNDLINKLQVITNNLGMSNVCVVPFSYLFLRGQGIKIFSLVAKFCREEDFLIKDLLSDDIDKNSYEGAIVFVPTPGVYFEPVVVMDYNSLYPSSMIAENISHDSIVGYKEYRVKPKKRETEPDEYELVKDTINEKYNNLEGYHYNDIEYDLFAGFDDDKKKIGYKVCKYAEKDNNDKSVIPRILLKLLKARKDTRKIMEYTTFEMIDGSVVQGVLKEEEGEVEEYELFNVDKGKFKIKVCDVVKQYETNNEFQKSVLDGLQLAYKVTCNSLYGQVGASTSPICFKELAASTTATGRKMVTTARDRTLGTFVGTKLTYGDSVTGDTPLLVRHNGYIRIISIEKLNEHDWIQYENFKPFDSNRTEKEQTYCYYEIWTNEGWSKINRVIRHKTNKKLYRVKTDTGVVDVTEDHSLLNKEKKIIKPLECKEGMELLSGFPSDFSYTGYSFINDLSFYQIKEFVITIYEMPSMSFIPSEILNAKKKDKITFLNIFFGWKESKLVNPSKVLLQGLFYLLKAIEKFDYTENLSHNIFTEFKENIYDLLKINFGGNCSIESITYLRNTEADEFVYDIETVSGNFHAGIGNIIVKNTDSIFVNFTDFIKEKYPDKMFSEEELLEESIKMGLEAAKNINKVMKWPQNIEYEKTFWPFCIFSKKRYFGNKYEHNTYKYKQTSMGIVLKRRDNAPIVKKIYGGVIDIILNQRNVELSKKFFYDSVKDLLNGKTDINDLIISKTLRIDYANPNQIAHKVLADRLGERDPGNKPQSNDRIPYCYIDASNLKCKICNGKTNPEKCKCITCMNIYCSTHLMAHKSVCEKVCRFCKSTEKQCALGKCNICSGWYCGKCGEKHKLRKDKYGEIHHDKCKKLLTNKLLQGDTIDHPQYIVENNLTIDSKYYLEHQIEKPVFQIFELVMKKPESIIEDLKRSMNNAKSGNQSITSWFKAIDKNNNVNKIAEEAEKNKNKKIELKLDDLDDEEEDLLGFEEEVDEYANIEEV